MSYFFHPGAEAEHLEAIAFYESRQLGLGSEYLTEFERVFALSAQLHHVIVLKGNRISAAFTSTAFPIKLSFGIPAQVSKFLPLPTNADDRIIG